MADRPPLEISTSRHFLAWLHEARVSLAFTTYQTNRLFLLGLKPDGSLSAFERAFDRPMGLAASADRLYLSTRWQIWRFDDALPPGAEHNGYDRLYVPRLAYTTGDLDVHDLAVDRHGRLIFVNTAYSCLAALSERYSFTPLWQPPFISRLAPEDRCHLNGLAMADGEAAYVTAVSRSDVAGGWRERREQGGCVIDVEDGSIVLDALSMPHSPRVYRDKLWVLNSGTGELGWIDRARARFEPLAFCPGFLRGMALHGDYAIVGLSQSRRERTFAGLALDRRLHEKDAEPRCGLWVIDLRSGTVVHWLQLEGVVIELYDVAVLPGVRRPMALGFQSDEIQRIIAIETAPQPLLHVLTAGDARVAGASTATAPRQRDEAEVAAAPGAASAAGKPSPAVPPEAERAYRTANQLAKAGRFGDAVPHYEEALRLAPDHVNALTNLGAVQHRLGRREEAAAHYRRALVIDPDAARAHINLALLLRDGGDLAGAVRHYDIARRLRPNDAEVLNQLGLALYEHGQLDEAARCLQRALELDPHSAPIANNLAGVVKVQGQRAQALTLHQRAAASDPSFFEAHENIGKMFEEESRVAEAKAAYQRALAIRDDAALALHSELLCPPVLADVAALDAYRRHVEAVVDAWRGRTVRIDLDRVQSSRAEPPYDWTYHGRDDLALKRKYAALFADGFPQQTPTRMPSADGPWHIGFVVTPSHEGVFVRCMSGIINRMDRRRFRITLVCTRPGEAALRTAISSASAASLHVPLRFDHTLTMIRQAAFDVLYYWEVGTDATNYFLPFWRLAPVQCTGWGWPDTSAAPALDLHVTSDGLAPAGAEAAYSERLVRLPHLPPYFFRSPSVAPQRGRERLQLPPAATLYVCAQNLRKLHPEFDAILGGILRADPKALAVLVEDTHPAAGVLLRQRWAAHLPDVADRIRLLPRLTPERYFELVACTDVMLDTLHFGGSNTAYDAFACGVPVITLPGALPRGRYTYAMYRAIGIDDGIAGSAADYVARAVRLGTDRGERQRLAARLARAATTLFEQPAAVTQLEDLFVRACRAEL
jgi:protein O-GlcNAc transferase